jgi:hypothetical protein
MSGTSNLKSPSKKEARNHHRQRIAKTIEDRSVYDFLDPSKPWVLLPGGTFTGAFNFVPAHLRQGPWSSIAALSLATILYLLNAEAIKMRKNGGFLKYFEASISDDYTAFNLEWFSL